MAKLAFHLATLALLLFLANASIHTTVTIDSEEENPLWRPGGSCQQQIMQQRYLEHCQMYMKEQCSGGRCKNPGSKHLDACCEQLEKLDKQCRCPGLKQALEQSMEGQMGREEMQEMQQLTDKILSKCDMEPRKCGTPRTTITLNSEENPSGGTQECSQQIKRQNYLKHCQQYMEEKCSCRGCKGCGTLNPSGSKHLDACCEQLEQLDKQCR